MELETLRNYKAEGPVREKWRKQKKPKWKIEGKSEWW